MRKLRQDASQAVAFNAQLQRTTAALKEARAKLKEARGGSGPELEKLERELQEEKVKYDMFYAEAVDYVAKTSGQIATLQQRLHDARETHSQNSHHTHRLASIINQLNKEALQKSHEVIAYQEKVAQQLAYGNDAYNRLAARALELEKEAKRYKKLSVKFASSDPVFRRPLEAYALQEVEKDVRILHHLGGRRTNFTFPQKRQRLR